MSEWERCIVANDSVSDVVLLQVRSQVWFAHLGDLEGILYCSGDGITSGERTDAGARTRQADEENDGPHARCAARHSGAAQFRDGRLSGSARTPGGRQSVKNEIYIRTRPH